MSPPVEKWEVVIPPSEADDAPAAVRRLPVPGGFLYQVERASLVEQQNRCVGREWHAPVFVGDGYQLEEFARNLRRELAEIRAVIGAHRG